MNPSPRSCPRGGGATRSAGFTLVELLAVMAILALLVGMAIGIVSKAKATGNETACQQQLRDISLNLTTYVDQRRGGKWPKESGIRFLLLIVKEDYYRGDVLKNFVCPSTDDQTSRAESDPPHSGITDWEDLDPDCISYAGRDNANFGLRKDRLNEEVVACDDNWYQGAGRPNHDGVTIVVYGDGHIGKLNTSDYKGSLPEGQDWLPVGPESPDESLKKLQVD